MNIRRSLGSLLVLLVTGAAAAQDYSPAGMFGEAHGDFLARMDRYRPMFRASFSLLPDASLDNDPGEFDQFRFLLDGMAPIPVDPDSLVLFGGTLEARRFEFDSDFVGTQDDTVGTIGLHLGYGHFFTEDTYVQAVFSPGLYSDLDDTLTSEDWQFFGEALGVFRMRDDLFLKGGFEVSEDYEDWPIFPLLGFSWLMTEQWRLDVLVPRYAELVYEASAASSIFGGIEIEGQEYHLRRDGGAGAMMGASRDDFDWRVQEVRLYLGGVHRFNDHLSFFARAGSAVAGDYELEGPAPGPGADSQLDPTFFGEVGFGIDF